MVQDSEFTIYADRLTLASCLAARRWPREGVRGSRRLVVLDPLPRGARGLIVGAWARLLGLRVGEAQFFAGHLRDDRGESVYRVARRDSAQIAFRAAADTVAHVPRLAALNARYGREALRLFLTKRVWLDIEVSLRKLLIGHALARQEGAATRMLLERPRRFAGDWLQSAVAGTAVAFYGGWRDVFLSWGSAVHGFAILVRAIARSVFSGPAEAPAAGRRPGVLCLQEDDLALDHTVRTQPHWLLPGDPRPPFQTYIWLNHGVLRAPFDRVTLEGAGVVPLSDTDVRALEARRGAGAAGTRLAREAAGCLGSALVSGCADRFALVSAAKLLLRARLAASVCRALGIRVFLSGESYLVDADAVQLVAPELGVATVSYQYSNISFVSPWMMNTADLMLLFSDMYRRNWTHDGVVPRAFAILGYPRESSAPVLHDRAARMRAELARAGARFVICYMDESVQHDRYGQVSAQEHEADIFLLWRALIADPSLGVIVKTQFTRNSPSRMFAGRQEFEAARATGRYLELCHGQHRNVALPAEAALASDIAIGHAIGGTAVLEAALAGRRCLMLNPYAWWGTWDELYRRADIVYPSLREALDAVAALRAGDPARQALGDWSSILPEFDPYRDGRSAMRLRALLEAILDGAPAAAAAGRCLVPPVRAASRPPAERLRA